MSKPNHQFFNTRVISNRQRVVGSGFGRLVLWVVWLLPFLLIGLSGATLSAQQADTTQSRIAAAKSKMDEAMQRVKDIVNQPVTQLPRKSYMRVAEFGPGGWFHPGAEKPDFNRVDVRTTQQFTYAKFDYVTSDLNPNVVYLGRELEFNSMTKYFYTDRTVPKKKLTETEMLEINGLYRIIGRCEELMADLQPPEQPPAFNLLDLFKSRFYGGALVLALLLFLVLMALHRRRPE